jgi:hypothetical protein
MAALKFTVCSIFLTTILLSWQISRGYFLSYLLLFCCRGSVSQHRPENYEVSSFLCSPDGRLMLIVSGEVAAPQAVQMSRKGTGDR